MSVTLEDIERVKTKYLKNLVNPETANIGLAVPIDDMKRIKSAFNE